MVPDNESLDNFSLVAAMCAYSKEVEVWILVEAC